MPTTPWRRGEVERIRDRERALANRGLPYNEETLQLAREWLILAAERDKLEAPLLWLASLKARFRLRR